jgi:hypothetical protein
MAPTASRRRSLALLKGAGGKVDVDHQKRVGKDCKWVDLQRRGASLTTAVDETRRSHIVAGLQSGHVRREVTAARLIFPRRLSIRRGKDDVDRRRLTHDTDVAVGHFVHRPAQRQPAHGRRRSRSRSRIRSRSWGRGSLAAPAPRQGNSQPGAAKCHSPSRKTSAYTLRSHSHPPNIH